MLWSILLMACSSLEQAALHPPSELPAIEALQEVTVARGPGDLAPDGELARIDEPGATLRLLDLLQQDDTRGVLVVFMADFCGVCASSLPQLADLEDRYGPQGLRLVVMGTDVNHIGRRQLVEKVRAAGLDAPLAIGAPYVQNAWLGETKLIPRYIFVDRAGRVVAHEQGYDDAVSSRLEAHVNAALQGYTG